MKKDKIEIEIAYGSKFQKDLFEVMFYDIIYNFASFFESKHKGNYLNSKHCYEHNQFKVDEVLNNKQNENKQK